LGAKERTNEREVVFNPLTMKKLVAIATVCAAALIYATLALADHPIEFGQTNNPPPVSCPSNCQAIGQVTGFEVQQGTIKNPMTRKRRGKVVAFSVTLGKPKTSDVNFFNKLFGNPPQVQLVVLKPGTKQRYRVTGISPAYDVTQYLGSTPTFALPRPLTVKPGYVVGLTVPTWAPAFAVNLGNDEAWRSSRDPKHCDDVQQKAAQVTRGQLASYGCLYRTARLMYTVTFIPDPRITNPQTPAKKKTGSG
jgi:hypothetical protein